MNRREHYGMSADVYSYGIMLWEMCCLKKPFKGMTKDEHASLVIHKGFRPKISSVPGSDDLKHLIQASWSSEAEDRPTFREIRRSLTTDLAMKKKLEEEAERQRQLLAAHNKSTGSKLIMRLRRQHRGSTNGTYKKNGGTPKKSNYLLPFSSR